VRAASQNVFRKRPNNVPQTFFQRCYFFARNRVCVGRADSMPCSQWLVCSGVFAPQRFIAPLRSATNGQGLTLAPLRSASIGYAGLRSAVAFTLLGAAVLARGAMWLVSPLAIFAGLDLRLLVCGGSCCVGSLRRPRRVGQCRQYLASFSHLLLVLRPCAMRGRLGGRSGRRRCSVSALLGWLGQLGGIISARSAPLAVLMATLSTF
jgi:hypothetical protein